MWGEERFHHLPEGWILALRTGTLLGDQVRPFLDRLEEAAVAEHKAVSRALARQFFENEGETLDIGE